MKGSKLFLQCISKLGIENIFGIVGGEAQAMQFDEESSINFYLTRHEFAAGIMADTFGRITGKPQMCYSTFGPGLTNLSTGVCSAILDRSPMLAVSAQIHRHDVKFNQTHQCIDNVAFMRTITKFSDEIQSVYDIPHLLKKAIRISLEGIPGPVYLSFPLDIMESEIDDNIAHALIMDLNPITRVTNNIFNSNKLDYIINKIDGAKQPLIVIGNQIIRENSTTELIELIEKLNIPCIVTLAAKGAIPENHPLFITPCNKYIDKIYQESLLPEIFNNTDLILLFGYDFGEDLKSNLWNNTTESIVINSDYEGMGDVFQPHTTYIGNLKMSLSYLLKSNIAPKDDNKKMLLTKRSFDKREPITKENTSNIPLIIRSLRNAIGPNGILCSDIGLHKQYAGLLSLTYHPNTFICSNVCGTFGFGLPAGLGAKLAVPNAKVCVICGDGGFHSTSQDLETAVRYNIPIAIVVLKDNAFGLIKYYQFLERNEINSKSVEFGNVDFVKLAEANGMIAQNIQNFEHLQAALELGFSKNAPFLIEVPIQYDYQLRWEEPVLSMVDNDTV